MATVGDFYWDSIQHMESSPTNGDRETANKSGLIARYPVASFFILALAISWIAWSPWWLGQDGLGLLPIPGSL